jgi:D-aspartate ligase
MACVLGEIDVVRALGLAGIDCAVAAVPGDPATYSRHVSVVLDWHDPWQRSEEMLESLLRFASSQRRPPVLFYNGDHDLLLVSRLRERLRAAFRFVVADEALVEDLVDKARFQRLAARLELPVPRTQVFGVEPGSAPRGFDLDFPFVVKPVTRKDETWRPVASGAKAVVIDTPGALDRLWSSLATGAFLAQELIAGAEDRVESYHAYVDDSSHIAAEFTGRKIRTHPPRFGDTTALVITESEETLRLGRDFVERLGITGVVKLDFKRAPDGRLFLLEVNPRFNLWHHPGAVAGVNIPAIIYADMVGVSRPSASLRAGVRWCQEVVAEGRRFMRFGVIPDVHANLPALTVALETLRREGVDAYLCPGDLVGYGPHPNECVELLTSVETTCVAGNHDLIAVGRLQGSDVSRLARQTLEWTSNVLRDDVRSHLARLPLVAEAPGGIVIAHGTIDDPSEYTRTAERAEVLLDHIERTFGASILLLGHTHRAWLVQKEAGVLAVWPVRSIELESAKSYLLNAGSVGQSRELRPLSRCAVLDLDSRRASFLALAYDQRRCRLDLRRAGLPDNACHVRPSFTGLMKQASHKLRRA